MRNYKTYDPEYDYEDEREYATDDYGNEIYDCYGDVIDNDTFYDAFDGEIDAYNEWRLS